MCSMDPATLVSKFPRCILGFHLLHSQPTFCVLVELIIGAFSHLFPYMLFFTDPEMMNTVELSLDTSIESFTEKHKVSSSQCLIDLTEFFLQVFNPYSDLQQTLTSYHTSFVKFH